MQDTVSEKDAKEAGGTEVLPHTQAVLDNAVQVAVTAKAVATAILTSKEPVSAAQATANKAYKYEDCHLGNIHVFDVGGLQVFGGGKSYDADFTTDDVDIILDVGAGVVVPTVLGNVRGMENLRAAMKSPTIIRLPWDDGWGADYDREFWEILAHDLLQFAELPEFTHPQGDEGPVYARLLVSCMGGHGRTGTALAILACLWGVVPEGDDPVKWLRQKYCKKAVENNRQLNYIEEITGRTTVATGSHTLYPTYTGAKYDTYGSYGTTKAAPATYENKGGVVADTGAWSKWGSKYPAYPGNDATTPEWQAYVEEMSALEEEEERLVAASMAIEDVTPIEDDASDDASDDDVDSEEELEGLSRGTLLDEEVELDEYYTLPNGTEVWDNGIFIYHRPFAGGPWLPRFMWVREAGHFVKRELSPMVLASLVNITSEKKEEVPTTIIES